jgi:endonuclease III
MEKRNHKKLQEVLALLAAAHGAVRWKCWGKPLDVLVETVLSQNTSNANSSAGYRQLRRRFRTWNAVADAPVGEVEKCIRVSGLSRVKAPRIQKILRQIRDQQQIGHLSGWHPQVRLGVSGNTARPSQGASSVRDDAEMIDPHGLHAVAKTRSVTHKGSASAEDDVGHLLQSEAKMASQHTGETPASRSGDLSLEFLRDMAVEQADRYLQSFDGVGPKTAACVLMFSFNMPIFPVDTHIHRIAIRLGLVARGRSAEETQQLLTPLIPSADRYAMHILLVTHGRKTCRARSPRCEWCGLIDLCPHGKKVAGSRS